MSISGAYKLWGPQFKLDYPMSTPGISKKRKLVTIEPNDTSESKRRKLHYDHKEVTTLLSALQEEEQLELRNYFLERFPLYMVVPTPWKTRLFFLSREAGETSSQHMRRIDFLMTLIGSIIIDHDDIFSKPRAIALPRGCVNLTTRLFHTLIPCLQATHFFLSKGDDLSSRCLMEPITVDGETLYAPAYKTFACETEEHAAEFMDPEDYEFFRDHCYEWNPAKLKELLETPGFIPKDADIFTINVGVINKQKQKFLFVDLEFLRLNL